MPRTLPTGLKELQQAGYAESHSIIALELAVPVGAPTSATTIWHYLGTSAITADGVSYRARLSARNAVSLLRQSLGSAIDRAEVTIEDADGAFTAELKQYGDNMLDGGKIRIGRVWQNLDTQQQYVTWLMTGIVSNAAHSDTAIQLSVVAETYAGGSIGGNRVATRQCPFDFNAPSIGIYDSRCGYVGAETTCNKLYSDAGGCSGRSNQHRYGGFVHLQGRAAVGGAVGLGAPPVTGATISNIPTQVYNVKRDYGATGNGSTDDTAAIQSAISAAQAVKGTVWFPPGTYKTSSTITATGNITLSSFSDGSAVIYSTTNAPIIATAEDANFEMPKIENLRIRGSVTAGSSQVGLKIDASTYGLRCVVRNVWIEDCGGYGLQVLKAFSSLFENVFATNCAGYPFLIDTANMPANVFQSCYAGNLRSSATTGFRIKAGEAIFYNCNGINSVPTGAKWAVVGKKNGVDGDSTDSGAYAQFTDCNIESFDTHGILAYHSSTIVVDGRTVFAGNGNVNQKGVEFDLAGDGSAYFAQLIPRGFIADTVNFADGVSAYKNSEPIHANGFAPIQLQSVGPATGGGVPLSTFRNATAGATQKLARAGGSASRLQVTATTNISQPGVRYIELGISAPATITIPWGGWYSAAEMIIIADVSGNLRTNNATIQVNSGATINGASSYVMDNDRQAIILMPDADTGAGNWRVVAAFQDQQFTDDRANGRVLSRRRIAAQSPAIGAPAFTFEAQAGLGMTRLADRILAFATETTTGAGGVEALRLDGSSGAIRSLFSGALTGANVDNVTDLGANGNYRFKDAYFSGQMNCIGFNNVGPTFGSIVQKNNPSAFNANSVNSQLTGVGSSYVVHFVSFCDTSNVIGVPVYGFNHITRLGMFNNGTATATPFTINFQISEEAYNGATNGLSYGLFIGALVGTTKIGIYDQTGSSWQNTTGTISVGTTTTTTAQAHIVSQNSGKPALYAEAHASSTVPAAEFKAPTGIAPVKFTNLNSNSTRTNGRTQALVVNTLGEVQVAAFGSQLFTATADASVANTTTETTAIGTGSGSLTIAGGTVEVGDRFEIELEGYHSSNGNSITLKFKIGGTTVCNTGSVGLPAGITSQRFRARVVFTVRSVGASGTVQAQMDAWLFNSNTGVDLMYSAINTTTTTIDTTSNQTLDVTAQWSIANVNNSLKVTNATLKKWRI